MKTGSENFIFAEGKEWEPAGEGVVRQIMGYNDDIMVVKVKFEKELQELFTIISIHK